MLSIYRILTVISFPVLITIGLLRRLINKENNRSLLEKIFSFSKKKFNKKLNLIWFHGSSIGEITSVLPIIHSILKKKKYKILLTSNSITSGNLINEKLGNKVFHQYLPLDLPHLNKKFLNKWSPKCAIFIDSEIWPNFIYEIKKRKIKLILINARITNKSFRRWKYFYNFGKKVFSNFDLCISSSLDTFKKLKNLNVKNVKYFGNLKYISELNKIKKLKKNSDLNKRKIWCASNTHAGEEIFCLNVHKALKKIEGNLLTIIAPRHINRSEEIFDLCEKNNLLAQSIKNEKEKINKNTDIVIINSFGILDYYYKFCTSVFMGKSTLKRLIEVGGQNPIEAARQGCQIYYGPYVHNFEEVYNFLAKKKIAKKIKQSEDLVKQILKDFKNKKKINKSRIKQIDDFGQKIFKNTILHINRIKK